MTKIGIMLSCLAITLCAASYAGDDGVGAQIMSKKYAQEAAQNRQAGKAAPAANPKAKTQATAKEGLAEKAVSADSLQVKTIELAPAGGQKSKDRAPQVKRSPIRAPQSPQKSQTKDLPISQEPPKH